jgi:hypothetical protein
LASLSFTHYLGDLLSISELSLTGKADSGIGGLEGTSILDTYQVYFNRQSYRVSTIVLSFFGFLLLWMFSLSLFACLYRHTCEKRLDPAGYKARTEVTDVKSHREREDAEFMEEVMRKEQEGGGEKSESRVIEGEVVTTPRIKGFKARDKKQKI